MGDSGDSLRPADELDPRLSSALELQLGRRREALGAGANVFHRAVAFSAPWRITPASAVEGRLIVNGEVRAAAPAGIDFADRVCAAARLLGAMGEQLQAGDRVITGSVVQVGIERGDEVIAELGVLGRVAVTIAP
jgi:hypothetical protein